MQSRNQRCRFIPVTLKQPVFNGCFKFQVWFTLPRFCFFPFPPWPSFRFLFFGWVWERYSHCLSIEAWSPDGLRCGSKFLHQSNLLRSVQNSVGCWLKMQEYHYLSDRWNLGDTCQYFLISSPKILHVEKPLNKHRPEPKLFIEDLLNWTHLAFSGFVWLLLVDKNVFCPHITSRQSFTMNVLNITLKKASQVERMFYFLFTFCWFWSLTLHESFFHLRVVRVPQLTSSLWNVFGFQSLRIWW